MKATFKLPAADVTEITVPFTQEQLKQVFRDMAEAARARRDQLVGDLS